MTLTLRIENYDTLEDGGPTWITLNQAGAQIGRRAAMDWVLPDPAKHISGHHFDIAFRDGAYWLTDVSTNGTFFQGQRHRLDGPQQLNGGERLVVGHYIIAVELAGGGVGTPAQDQASVHGWTVGPSSRAADDGDPWDFGGEQMDPVNPLPNPASDPHHLDDVAQEFVPLQRPTMPPGAQALPVQQPQQVAPAPPSVQQPPVVQSGAAQLSHPPFVPPPQAMPTPPAHDPAPVPQPQPAPIPQPVSPPVQQQPAMQIGDVGQAMLDAFCRGAGLNPAAAQGSDPIVLAEKLGQSARVAAEEIMQMLQDRANVKQFTRGGERTMRSATGNNPMKFLPDTVQALETMFVKPRDGFMTAPDGYENALKDLRLHQMAVFAALQPALAEVLKGLSPDEIEGRQTNSSNLLGGGKGRHWDSYVKRWDEKAGKGDHGMLDAFLQAFSRAYMDACMREAP
jgi:type VI secretion system protein ImpI